MAVHQHLQHQDQEQPDQREAEPTTCPELEPLSRSACTLPARPFVAAEAAGLSSIQASSSLWWRGVFLTDKMRSFLFLWIFVLLVLHVASGGQRDEPSPASGRAPVSVKHYDANPISFDSRICSRVCQCEGNAVDCSNRGLTQIPNDLPKDADKM